MWVHVCEILAQANWCPKTGSASGMPGDDGTWREIGGENHRGVFWGVIFGGLWLQWWFPSIYVKAYQIYTLMRCNVLYASYTSIKNMGNFEQCQKTQQVQILVNLWFFSQMLFPQGEWPNLMIFCWFHCFGKSTLKMGKLTESQFKSISSSHSRVFNDLSTMEMFRHTTSLSQEGFWLFLSPIF